MNGLFLIFNLFLYNDRYKLERISRQTRAAFNLACEQIFTVMGVEHVSNLDFWGEKWTKSEQSYPNEGKQTRLC